MEYADTPPSSTVIAVLLAAGLGSRFTGPSHKLLAELPGSDRLTVFETSLKNVISAGFAHIVVVTGAAAIPDAMLRHPSLHIVHNNRFADGQATSIVVGIAEAKRLGATSVVIGLADQPFISPQAWQRIASSSSPVAVATYDNRRGHPVRLDSSIWELLPRTGDSGARELISLRPELVSQVDCPGSAADIDTREDLQQWI